MALLFFVGTALFVGGFLVFNALSMTVLERTRELGMFRALGSTRAMISFSVIAEALALGVFGSVLGVLLGYGMAQMLAYLFGRAFRLGASTVAISPSALIQAVAVGILITVLAALYPALRAGMVSPVEAMRTRSSKKSAGRTKASSRLLPLLGLLLVGAGAPWFYRMAGNLSTDRLTLSGWRASLVRSSASLC